MKTLLVAAVLWTLAAALTVAYAAGISAYPCATFVEGSCPEFGAQGSCPDGTPCLWGVISFWEQKRTLCSCYTEGCGPGPCNRLVQWSGTMYDMGCYGTEPQPCKIKRCWDAGSVLPAQFPSQNCDLDPCNGPCPHPVFPL